MINKTEDKIKPAIKIYLNQNKRWIEKVFIFDYVQYLFNFLNKTLKKYINQWCKS